MSPFWSWVYTIVVVGGYFAYTVLEVASGRRRKGLAADKMELVVLRAGVIAVVGHR